MSTEHSTVSYVVVEGPYPETNPKGEIPIWMVTPCSDDDEETRPGDKFLSYAAAVEEGQRLASILMVECVIEALPL